MENVTTELSCEVCLRPKAEEGAPPKSQWISVCRCQLTYAPNAQFALEWCMKCRKKIPVHAGGKTDATFERAFLCACSSPEPAKIPAVAKPGEAGDVAEMDLSICSINPQDFPVERYMPLGILGQSAKADTLFCRDKQSGRRVAVKCFKSVPVHMLPTFEQEARKISQLSHTNIAKVVDKGVLNGKIPYLVTEYKDGFSLDQYFAMEGVPSHDVAVKILVGMLEALVYSKKDSLLHRSLKPGNVIFLDDMNSEPSIAITDYGISAIKKEWKDAEAGDAHYMSGDEARNMDYDERSEMYSVGCVGYSLLTARTPFDSDSALSLKNKHALELPVRISNINFDRGRPGDLDEVIERCLEKNPKDRFDSLEKLMERLQVFPRRVQMRVAAAEAARQKQKMIKLAAIAVVIFILIAIVSMVLSKH